MKRALLSGLALFAALAGCDAANGRYCKVGATRVVASTTAKVIDGMVLAPAALGGHTSGALLAWSDANGTFARTLDAQGQPLGELVRVAERCDGGVALASSAAGVALGCLRRAVPGDLAQLGSAIVYALALAREGIAAEERASYTPAGSLSDGIALAWVSGETKTDAPALALAWHDASPDVHRVWLVADAYGKHPAQHVSSEGSVANAPLLIADDDQLALAWSERSARGDELESNTMLWTGEARLDAARGKASAVSAPSEARTSSTASTWVEPYPQLVFLSGGLVVGYRAPGRGGKRPGLHIARIEGELGSHGIMKGPRMIEPARVGRADGVGRPSLAACMGGIVTATPRSYAGDYFIGLNWLSSELRHPRREQQFYEDARAFTQASAACLGDRALIALAELPQLDRPEADLHIATYVCE